MVELSSTRQRLRLEEIYKYIINVRLNVWVIMKIFLLKALFFLGVEEI